MTEQNPTLTGMSKKQRIETYQGNYLANYDFESVMVWARQKYIAGLIEELER